MEEERKTLKYFLDNKNFSRLPLKKFIKKEPVLQVIDDQIVMNRNIPENIEDEIVTSYTYMKKKGNGKRWNIDENKRFYKALECCGCDFSMMNLIFPDRTRRNLKEKYKKESRANLHRVEDALDNFKAFDIETFNQLRNEAQF
ncbi:hypothetical protein GINT2_000642 [Glugoides intestinalis]